MTYSNKTRQFLDKMQLDHPLIQAPMVGVSNPALAAAVAAGGGLGSLGLSSGSAQTIESTFAALKPLSNHPVNLNFFCHAQPKRNVTKEAAWLNRLTPLFAALDKRPPSTIDAPYGTFDDDPDTLAALLDHQARIVSFHFGLPSRQAMQALNAQGTLILASATSVEEAKWLEANGVDAIIAQGFEAGGHRGRFISDKRDEQLGTLVLVPLLTNAVNLPVIAAGGINNGSSAAAALTLGAAAVQIGTAFVTCAESSAAPAYRAALGDTDRQTLMTAVFSGREARGLENAVTTALHEFSVDAPDYPVAYDAGKALAAAAITTNDEQSIQDHSAMWAGQGFRTNRVLPAEALVALIAEELRDALS